MSSAERWQQVEAALDAVLQAEPEDRAAILDRLYSGDPELRSEVASLLAADATTDGFLETTADGLAASLLSRVADEPSLSDTGGGLVGRYRLVEEIGRGGMGTVWLAERADGQYEQRVALKLVKRGMDTDEILTRFRRERQILARLEHPNIARLLDGGVSEDGRPYFVMESVAGIPITEYCDAKCLSIDDRLRLFSVVCRVVQHAHRNLVVHRDLKPTNVLVTEDGEVKLLDFGIAKLLGEDGLEAAALTSRIPLMTPEYASPEQLDHDPVTTASDVYQLGILLYELLSGRRPYGTARQAHLLRATRQGEPRRPSTAIRQAETVVHRDGTEETIEPALVSRQRGTTPGRLRRRLSGDLDVIALRALRAEPERRQPSAEALAEDVERYLAHLPIRFSGRGYRYRATKFIRRHRLGVAVAALLVVLGATAGSVYTVQIRAERDRVRRERDRAQLEADKAIESAQLLRRFFQSWDPDAADRGQVSAEQVLESAARRAEQELHDRPEMLAATLSVLGDLNTALGQNSAADSLLSRALAIQERLVDEPTTDLAATLARRGRLLNDVNEHTAAAASLKRSLELHRQLLGPRHPATLGVQYELSITLWPISRLAEAESLLRDILAKSPAEPTPFTTEVATELGYVLYHQARYDEAAEILRPTLARQRRIFGRFHPSTLRTMRFLVSSLRKPGEMDEAAALSREAWEITLALYGKDHLATRGAAMNRSVFLERKGQFEEAERFARMAVESGDRHNESGFWPAQRIGWLGGIRLARGDADEAEALLRRAAEMFREAELANLPDRGDVLNRLAWVLVARGATDAQDVYRDAVGFERARPATGPFFITDGYEYLAAAARARGDLALAEGLYRRALGLYRAELPEGHPYRAQTAVELGQTLLDAGRPAEAARYMREGLAQWQKAQPPAPSRVAETNALLVRAAQRS